MQNPRLEIRYIDEMGKEICSFCYDFEPRYMRPIKKPCPITGSLAELLHAKEQLQMRRDSLSKAGYNLGAQVAQLLTDLEGWHGEKRQEKTKESLQKSNT